MSYHPQQEVVGRPQPLASHIFHSCRNADASHQEHCHTLARFGHIRSSFLPTMLLRLNHLSNLKTSYSNIAPPSLTQLCLITISFPPGQPGWQLQLVQVFLEDGTYTTIMM